MMFETIFSECDKPQRNYQYGSCDISFGCERDNFYSLYRKLENVKAFQGRFRNDNSRRIPIIVDRILPPYIIDNLSELLNYNNFSRNKCPLCSIVLPTFIKAVATI